MEQGRLVLDRQYLADEWGYLRFIEEAPRFGIVSAYCRTVATGGSILEIGCGEGFLLEKLDAGRFDRFTGIDISSVAIDRAQSLAGERTDFTCADAETFVPDQRYAVIVFNEVLEYFDDPLQLVQRYDDYVTPGGHFIVSMFAGIDTARTRRIWRSLDAHYEAVASSRVTTLRDHTWIIKVFAAAHPA
jgi:2-polyprenyl-3-methyl-5-hydroxy-6-metoxy-1,4-benzoquinol methylase